MVKFKDYRYLNYSLHLILLLSFTLTSIPIQADPSIRNGVNEILFWIKMEKLIVDFVKSEKKSTETIICQFVDIKKEIEFAYNVKFDLENYLCNIAKELIKKGIKVPHREFDHILNLIRTREEGLKRKNTHYVDHAKKKKDKDKPSEPKKPEEEIIIPTLLVYGVTMALCGFFMMCLPVPACKDWGGKMVVAGITACANSLSTKNDENKKKNEKK